MEVNISPEKLFTIIGRLYVEVNERAAHEVALLNLLNAAQTASDDDAEAPE